MWTLSEREAFRIGIDFGGIAEFVGREGRSGSLSDFQAPDEFSLSSNVSARDLEVDESGQLSVGRCRSLEPDKSSVGDADIRVLALEGVMASGERRYSPEMRLLVVGVNE
jgi:hypothetical protein